MDTPAILSSFAFRARTAARVIPRCLRDPRQIKYLLKWRRTFWSSALADEQPWITFSAREWLESVTHDRMIAVEYGSGGSTLFLSRRVKRLLSIEHDPEWFALMSDLLKPISNSHVTCLLRVPQLSATTDDSQYFSRRYPDPQASFQDYVRAIDTCADRSLDLVLVDGRARNACIAHALPKLKAGGWLVLDNSDRADYSAGRKLLRRHKCLDFGGLCPYSAEQWTTTAWQIEHVDQ